MSEVGNIIIVDEMMGSGKSSAAINHINNSDERFLVITPYLDEVNRYKASCPNKHFKEPIRRRGSKLVDIKHLLSNGENIVSTHALFQRFDQETIDLCKSLRYNLIMDEVAEVVQEYSIKKDDFNLLLNGYCEINEDGHLVWLNVNKDYSGDWLYEIKNLCDLDGLAVIRETLLMWLFPVKVFQAFKNVYVLTYMFHSQLQRYYYDYYGLNYSYWHVAGDNIDNYHFAPGKSSDMVYIDYHKLIHILNDDKMNILGDPNYSLSKTWYDKYKNSALLKQAKNNLYNYFRNIRGDNSKDNIWTTFKDYKATLSGKGYTKGFIPLNMRATNSYKERTSLAYMVNIFLHPVIKGFFQDHGVTVDEDGYALSEMLQWIWRSAIRDGKEIWIYIPSSRMRKLLISWIDKISREISA